MRGVFDPDKLESELKILTVHIEDENLWKDQERAQKVMKEKSHLENTLKDFNFLKSELQDNIELFDIAKDEKDDLVTQEVTQNLQKLKILSDKSKTECLFSGKADKNDCFLEINTGVGGSDACDFSSMLLRMYDRWASKHDFKVEVIAYLEGDEAGIKSATLKISGHNAYGWARTESGIHRLVRISPFNSSGKRQTSFSSVWIYPVVEDEIEIEIEDKELRIDTYRASGAGGQHVNKTDSAVRITHLPTNIVVQCQNDRSQIRNKAECMKMLKSRLYELELRKRQEEQDEINASKSDNGWGHQIRSYVMHPYQMVKDLRTSYEVGNYQSVLDGDLDGFIKAALEISTLRTG